MSENGTVNFMHQDHLSGTALMTDTNSDQIDTTMKYYPFGVCRNSQHEIENFPTDRLFTSQRLDDTGLYYYGARYYDVTIGRFISADPSIPESGNPQSYNRYSYCINNPLSAINPNGLHYIFVCGSAGNESDWDSMIKALNIDTAKERILFVPDLEHGYTSSLQA